MLFSCWVILPLCYSVIVVCSRWVISPGIFLTGVILSSGYFDMVPFGLVPFDPAFYYRVLLLNETLAFF